MNKVMLLLLIILQLISTAEQTELVRQNVIFQKTNEITTSRARWLASFIVDLEPFDRFLSKIMLDVGHAKAIVETVKKEFKLPEENEYVTTFEAIEKEINYLKNKCDAITDNFNDLKMETTSRSRVKRGVLNFVGKFLSFAFGVVDESQLESIHENIKIIAARQANIIHVVEESLTILNVSRLQIQENRQAIIQLITAVHSLDHKLGLITQTLKRQIFETKYFLNVYTKLDLVVEEIKTMLQQAMFYLEHLKDQINFLSLGTISPSLISPHSLRSLLLEIKTHLPPLLTLIGDPNTELWFFYKQLTSMAIMDGRKIIVVLSIPLLRLEDTYEVYRVHNLPMPLCRNDLLNKSQMNLIATYNLEATSFLINKARSQYALLTDEEGTLCDLPETRWCSTKSPTYFVNLSKLCLIQLFLGLENDISKLCRVTISLDTRLPLALSLYNYRWAIVTTEQLRFSVVCGQDNNKVVTKIVNPPLSIIELPCQCTASNNYLSITSFCDQYSEVQVISDDDMFLQSVNFTESKIWQPFTQKFPNYTSIQLPPKLKDIGQIPMQHLISELENMKQVNIVTPKPPYLGLSLGTFIFIVLLTVVCCCCYKKGFCSKFCSAISLRGYRRKRPTEQSTEKVELSTMPATSTGQSERSAGGIAPPSSTNESKPVERFIRLIYPRLPEETVTSPV